MDERSHTHEIEIAASAEEVWNAITNPSEIRKWFEEVGELEPREGGTFRFSMAGDEASRIEVWDPPRRFRVASPPTPAPGGGGTPEAAAQSFDYEIESRGNRCILRMTHSGIPLDSSWDPYYDATNTGWGAVFRTMRHIVEEKPGEDVEKFTVFGGTDLSIAEVWRGAFGNGGLFEEIGDRGAETPFDITTSLGDRWSGTILYRRDPEIARNQGGLMTLSVDQLGGALVGVATEPMMGPKNIVGVSIITFDLAYAEAAERYRKLFEESFEVEPLQPTKEESRD
jgi:hypothetical protein